MSTNAPSWLDPAVSDWPTFEQPTPGDILVDQGAAPEYLDLAGWDYNSLDPTLWAIVGDSTASLDLSPEASSASEPSFGAPLSTTTSILLPPLPALPPLPSSSTSPIFDPEVCWSAVLSRDRSADSLFVYTVKTTKIYCRPICSARRPLRANVSFYTTPKEAEEAGFRPCLRCKPRDDVDPAEKRQAEAVEAAKRVIRERVQSGGKIGLEELSKVVDLSAFHLHRTFRKRVGCTPEGFAKQVKQEMVARATRGVGEDEKRDGRVK